MSRAFFKLFENFAPGHRGIRIVSVGRQATVEFFGLCIGKRKRLRLIREAFPEIVGELLTFGRGEVAEVE